MAVVDTFAERLFHRYYLISIPAHDYYHPEFIAKFGMHVHPDPEIAKAMLKDRIQDHFAPAMIAAWASDDVAIRFSDPNDVVVVFKDIMGHLADWRDHLETMPLFVDIPLEGLHQFYQLARTLYRDAREYGLADDRKRRLPQYRRSMMFRSVSYDKSDNPFNFSFNGTIWQELLQSAEMAGYNIKRYKDASLAALEPGTSGSGLLGSTNVNIADRYSSKRKHRKDARDPT